MSRVSRRAPLLRSASMTPRPPAAGDAGRHAAPPRRGLAAAVVVAMIGIGSGTWVLGSGEDPGPAAPQAGFSGIAVLPDAPEAERQGPALPALSVAPAPSDAAYAAARRAGGRADRAGRADAAPAKKKPAVRAGEKAKTDPASTDVVAAG
jgi:hypothetical protein